MTVEVTKGLLYVDYALPTDAIVVSKGQLYADYGLPEDSITLTKGQLYTNLSPFATPVRRRQTIPIN